MSGEKRQSLRSEAGAAVARLRLFLMDRKYKVSQGELQALERWVDRCHWWATGAALFFLLCCTVTSSDINYLRERDGDAEMLFFSVTVAACSL